jgi:acyl-CoA synthetase (AMP-forming)/AMP-acid ligase II
MTINCQALGDVVRLNAEKTPENIALHYLNRDVSFNELDARSDRVAAGLQALGLKAGSRVALLNKNSATFFDVLFGAAKANAVLVTVNFRLAREEVRFIVEDSEAEVLIVGREHLVTVEGLATTLETLNHILVIDDTADCEFAAWRDQQAQAPAEIIIDRESAVVQMYTSGTTGLPKGVELSHRAMINAAIAGLDVWQFLYEPESAVLATMPLFHIAACNLCIAALFVGARADIIRDATPEELADILPARGINLVPIPATVIHSMLRLPDIADKDFSALKVMLIAGSGIAAELLKEAGERFDCGFALSYGSTEMCGGVTYLGPDLCRPDAGKRLESAGRLLAHSELKIVSDQGVELPQGEVGEIIVRSNRLMNGYWHRPEANEGALRDGWFYSGDAGYVDENGLLFVVDRIKDMVISGGENIYPVEIEQVMHTHPAVEDVAIVGVPDDKWGESLLAFVVLKVGAEQPKPLALIEFLRPRLAGYKIPRRYEFIEAFPRNAMGKVLKRELRAPYWEKKEA